MGKPGYIVLGLVLLIGGVVGFFWAQDQINEYETSLGQIARAFNQELEDEYQQAKFIRTASSISAIVGIVFVILGATKKDKKKDLHQINQVSSQPNQQISLRTQSSDSEPKFVEKIDKEKSQHTFQSTPRPPKHFGSKNICPICRKVGNPNSKFCDICGESLIEIQW